MLVPHFRQMALATQVDASENLDAIADQGKDVRIPLGMPLASNAWALAVAAPSVDGTVCPSEHAIRFSASFSL